MRKRLFGLTLIILAICCFFVACDGKEQEYKLSLEKTEYEAVVGETFTVPVPTVSPESETCVLEWTVKFGDKDIAKNSDGTGFVVSEEGNYTITYTVKDALSQTLFVTVKSSAVKRDTAAPVNVSVDTDGVISFDATAGRKCELYINGVSRGEVTNGENVKSRLSDGENAVAVKVVADDFSNESALSQSVTVNKCAPITLEYNDWKISFQGESGKTYGLYVSGEYKCNVVTGETNIKEYITDGTNEVYVITRQSGFVESEFSNVISLIAHKKIDDFALTADGKATFTGKYSFVYKLIVDGAEKDEIKSGQNISSEFENFSAGTHTFSVKVIATAENTFVLDENVSSNQVTIEKLAAPVITSVENGQLAFTCASGASAKIYVDGTDKGNVTSGASLVKYYYGTKETIELKLRAEKDGCIASELSAAQTATVPEAYRLIDGNVAYDSSYTYSDGSSVSGVKVTAKQGESTKILKKTDFSGDLLKIAFCNYGGAYEISQLTIRFTDAETKQTLDILIYQTGDSVKMDGVYLGWSFNGQSTGLNGLCMFTTDMSDNGSNIWGSIQSKQLTISVDENGFYFAPGAFNNGWTTRFPSGVALDCGDFGKNGVYMEIIADNIVNAETASYIIAYHGAMD